MKSKVFITSIILTLAALIFYACEETYTYNPDTDKLTVEENTMIGMWEVTAIYINGDDYFNNPLMDMFPDISCLKQANISFSEEMSMCFALCADTLVSTYKFEDKECCIKESGIKQCVIVEDNSFMLDIPRLFIYDAIPELEQLPVDITSFKAKMVKKVAQ